MPECDGDNHYQRMNIYLYGSKKQGTKQYSTNAMENSGRSSRVFQQYRSTESGSSTARTKVCNMNDEERRIKRQHSALYRQSTSESSLFEKGIKKITPNQPQTSREHSIRRSYHNKQSATAATSAEVGKTGDAGVRRIYLYDQRKQSNPNRSQSENRKKFVQCANKQSQQKDGCGLFLLKKLPTHKNCPTEWHNQMTIVQLRKKQNVVNKENVVSEQAEKLQKKSFKDATNNMKNCSNFTSVESGITLREGTHSNSKGIDFKQDYYTKQSKIQLTSGSRSRLSRHK